MTCMKSKYCFHDSILQSTKDEHCPRTCFLQLDQVYRKTDWNVIVDLRYVKFLKSFFCHKSQCRVHHDCNYSCDLLHGGYFPVWHATGTINLKRTVPIMQSRDLPTPSSRVTLRSPIWFDMSFIYLCGTSFHCYLLQGQQHLYRAATLMKVKFSAFSQCFPCNASVFPVSFRKQ